MAKRSGLQYEFDKAARAFTPQRTIDAWGLRHPLVNALAFVVVTAVLALACVLALHAWYGALVGAALGGLVTLRTRPTIGGESRTAPQPTAGRLATSRPAAKQSHYFRPGRWP